jgi:hypothetical protein
MKGETGQTSRPGCHPLPINTPTASQRACQPARVRLPQHPPSESASWGAVEEAGTRAPFMTSLTSWSTQGLGWPATLWIWPMAARRRVMVEMCNSGRSSPVWTISLMYPATVAGRAGSGARPMPTHQVTKVGPVERARRAGWPRHDPCWRWPGSSPPGRPGDLATAARRLERPLSGPPRGARRHIPPRV